MAMIRSSGSSSLVTRRRTVPVSSMRSKTTVTGDVPRDDRRRRRTHWTLNHSKLHADLRALIQATTPTGRDADSLP